MAKPWYRIHLYRLQSGLCGYCQKKMLDPAEGADQPRSNHPDFPTFDHVSPRSRQLSDRENTGGTNHLLVCRACNMEKSNMPVIVFLAQRHQPTA